MVSSEKRDWIKILGIYVLISVSLNLIHSFIKFGDLHQLLWYCDYAAIILGICLIIKHRPWISAILVMSVTTQARWIIDFFLQLAGMGRGRTAMMLDWGILDTVLAVNLHAIIIPISLYAVIKLGFSKKAWIGTLITVFVLLPLTFLLTDIDDNLNCVFYPCDDIYEEGEYYYKPHYLNYFIINVLGFWTITVLVTYAIMRWIIFKNNIYEEPKEKKKLKRNKNKKIKQEQS